MKTRVPLWRDFFTQEEIRDAVRAVLKDYPLETEFDSPLIADLIAERHYFCSFKGLRPVKFKKTGKYKEQLLGFFEGLGWHPVSWHKSAGKPPSVRDQINQALRLRIQPLKTPYFQTHRNCEYCNDARSEEIHHEAPEWKEIMDMLFTEVSHEDVDAVMKTWDWFKSEEFRIPDDSRVAIAFDRIHREAVLKALCKICHKATRPGLKAHKTSQTVRDRGYTGIHSPS